MTLEELSNKELLDLYVKTSQELKGLNQELFLIKVEELADMHVEILERMGGE